MQRDDVGESGSDDGGEAFDDKIDGLEGEEVDVGLRQGRGIEFIELIYALMSDTYVRCQLQCSPSF
jgi:hypothetical protein